MSKRWEVQVQDYPVLRTGRVYRMRITSVTPIQDRAGIAVTLEHADEDHAGRAHEVVLPLPVRPTGITASFFLACGIQVSVGTKIAPRQMTGGFVGARFRQSADGHWSVASFEQAQGEPK